MDQNITLVEKYFEQIIPQLYQLKYCDLRLRSVADQVDRLISLRDRLNSLTQAGSPETDAAIARLLEEKEELSRCLGKEIILSQNLNKQATELINKYTDERQRYIVTARYLSGYTWPQISEGMSNPLSVKQLRRICRAALSKIILPEDAIWIERHEEN